jgi:hypothetical protein
MITPKSDQWSRRAHQEVDFEGRGELLVFIRRAVLHRSTALATRDLIVNYSPMGAEAGVTGAIHLAQPKKHPWRGGEPIAHVWPG